MVFLDFEASSLDPDSWPVEVGLAWLAEDGVQVRSSLIQPHYDWPMHAWSRVSARVHGIPLRELRRAPPAPDVARWVAGLVADGVLVSDAPEWDGRWLARLNDAVDGLTVPRVVDFDQAVATRFAEAAVRRVYAALDRIPAPHRAGPDATRLAQAWAAGMRGGS